MANKLKTKAPPPPNPDELKADKEVEVTVKEVVKDERTTKIAGAISLLVAAFLFIAFTSYCFTWQQDQDKVFRFTDIFKIDNNNAVSNLLGVLGAYIAHVFIRNGFGLASYLFCTFFFVLGANLLFDKKIFSIVRNLRYLITGLLVLSVSFSFFFQHTAFSFGGAAGELMEAWPLPVALHHATKLVNDMQCIAAWKEIPIGAFVRLMDSVKTRILGYVIDLERESPNAGDTPIGSQPPISGDKMTQIFNTNISGNVANLSNAGSSFTQTTGVAIAGNWDALTQKLLAVGLTPSDLLEVRPQLEQDAANTDNHQKSIAAGGWIGKLISKAMSGASGVAVEVASTTIAKAIAGYLGLPGA